MTENQCDKIVWKEFEPTPKKEAPVHRLERWASKKDKELNEKRKIAYDPQGGKVATVCARATNSNIAETKILSCAKMSAEEEAIINVGHKLEKVRRTDPETNEGYWSMCGMQKPEETPEGIQRKITSNKNELERENKRSNPDPFKIKLLRMDTDTLEEKLSHLDKEMTKCWCGNVKFYQPEGFKSRRI